MPFVEWSDEFSTGIEEIDGEHKRLLELLNALHDAVDAGCAHEQIDKALDELKLYGIVTPQVAQTVRSLAMSTAGLS